MIESLHRVARATRGNDRITIANVIVEEARTLVGAGGGILFQWDLQDQVLVPISQAGISRAGPDVRELALVRSVFESGRPARVGGLHQHAGLAVRLGLSETPLGCLLVRSDTPTSFDQEATDLLALFANLAMPHLAVGSADHQDREHESLVTLAEPANTTLPFSPAQVELDSIAVLLRAEVISLHWWDPEDRRLRCCTWTRESGGQTTGTTPDHALSSQAFRLQEPIVVDRGANWPVELSHHTGRGLGSAVSVPLMIAARTIGTLTAYRVPGHPFRPEDVELLKLLGRLIAPRVDPSEVELESREAQEMMSLALANAPMVFALTNHDRLITMIQGHGLEMSGYPASLLIGKSLDLLIQKDQDMIAGLMLALNGTRTQLVWTSSVSGHRWASFLAPVFDSAGRVKEACGVLIDVTAQQEAEVARRESEAKSRFLAIMSHEVRTPLNAILGFAQLLQRQRKRDQREARYIGNILSSGHHLLKLINDLLDLAKIQAGQLEVKLESLNMHRVASQAAEFVSSLAATMALELRNQVPTDLAVMADERHLNQVLVNLLSNALELAEAGGAVTMSAHGRDGEVEIRIETGAEFDPADQERLFEDFAEAGADTLRPKQGTGLELPLSRRLVELLGGQLTLESRAGQGGAFCIRLPAPPSHRPPESDPSRTASAA